MSTPDPWSTPPRRPKWLWPVVAGGVVAALVFYLAGRFPETLLDETARVRLVYLLALLAFLGSGLFLRWWGRPRRAFGHLGVWLAIGALLLVAYSFRDEGMALGNRLLGELLPHRGVTGGDAVTFRARANGHFVIEAEVNGTPVRFLLDTGASVVTLSPADARRLGFDPATLAFTHTFRTANGTVRGAPVRLARVTVGPITLEDVRASVNGAPMGHSLLGMSFLERLSAYEVAGGRLTLRR